ncbi:hypothetical protein GCM10023188_09430 [Pontibacter saemangeumensis]|uniref:RCC1-like domain-containing protein n=1 Tax=Pontibacter saemangeumensis TaxID=1084525 RepID=A0ABP8LCY6_9BACT
MKKISTIAGISNRTLERSEAFQTKQRRELPHIILLLFAQLFLLAGATTNVNAQTLGTGGAHHCSTASAGGKIYTWGANYDGQLGNNSYTRATTLQDISAYIGTKIISLANGNSHTLALDSDGRVWAWGNGEYGQLGNSASTDETKPVMVRGALEGIKVEKIAAGAYHSMALDEEGNVYTWGYGRDGQLGDGVAYTVTPYGLKLPVKVLTGMKAIAGGARHSLALSREGKVFAWGYGREGQIGNSTGRYTNRPGLVNGLSEVIDIAAGSNHSLAIAGAAREVYAWGYGFHGQLGNGSYSNSAVPATVQSLSGIKAIAGGAWHSLAIGPNGEVFSWGHGAVGQLGTNSYEAKQNTPSLINFQGIDRAISIAGGTWHSLAIGSDYQVYAWGDGYHGTLGSNYGPFGKRYSSIPVKVSTTNLGAPTASLSGGGTVCVGSSKTLSVALTGKSPWTISYKSNDETTYTTIENIITNRDGVYTFEVTPMKTSSYELTNVIDGNGVSGTFSGTATVHVALPSVNFRVAGEFTVDVNSTKKTYSLLVENSEEETFAFSDYTWAISGGSINLLANGQVEITWPSSPNVYAITVTYNNGACDSQSFIQYVSVYDPNGSVTGGGWINSPQNTIETDYKFMKEPGRASFGFVALNKKGGETIGNTEFNFRAGEMNFKSSSYNQEMKLVITEAGKIMYKGWGTINGNGNYEFTLTAYDEQYKIKENTAIDRLRMQIWDLDDERKKVYDNMLSGDEFADPILMTAIGDGAIMIHKKLSQSGRTAMSFFPDADNESPISSESFYNYPNNFSAKTTITFSLVKEQVFLLEIYDLKGSLIKKISSGTAKANMKYQFELTAGELADGIYLARLVTESGVKNLKMLLKK